MARRAGRLIYTLAMAATAATLAVSCGDTADEPARAVDVNADSDAIAREPAAATEAASEDPGEEAMQLYLASNDYMERALRVPNPEDPALGDYFTGAALNESAGVLLTAQQETEYFESSLVGDPTVVSSDETEVVLTDCVTETATTFDAITGQEKGSGTTVRKWQIRLVATDVGWRVDEIIPQEESCTP